MADNNTQATKFVQQFLDEISSKFAEMLKKGTSADFENITELVNASKMFKGIAGELSGITSEISTRVEKLFSDRKKEIGDALTKHEIIIKGINGESELDTAGKKVVSYSGAVSKNITASAPVFVPTRQIEQRLKHSDLQQIITIFGKDKDNNDIIYGYKKAIPIKTVEECANYPGMTCHLVKLPGIYVIMIDGEIIPLQFTSWTSTNRRLTDDNKASIGEVSNESHFAIPVNKFNYKIFDPIRNMPVATNGPQQYVKFMGKDSDPVYNTNGETAAFTTYLGDVRSIKYQNSVSLESYCLGIRFGAGLLIGMLSSQSDKDYKPIANKALKYIVQGYKDALEQLN